MVYMFYIVFISLRAVPLVSNVYVSLSSTASCIPLPGLCQGEGWESSAFSLQYDRRFGLLDASDIPMSSAGPPAGHLPSKVSLLILFFDKYLSEQMMFVSS